MRAWRQVIVSAAVSVGALVVLAAIGGETVDVPAGVVLLVALTILARSAMRLAGEPARRDAPPPRG